MRGRTVQSQGNEQETQPEVLGSLLDLLLTPPPVPCVSDGGAQRGAPAELLRRHHVQPLAVSWPILPGPSPRPRQRRRPAQGGAELLQRQPGGGSALRAQEAAARGNVGF